MRPLNPQSFLDTFQTAASCGLMQADRKKLRDIVRTVPGYSGEAHYLFFKACLLAFPIESLLVLGVYRGRDICMLLSIAADYDRPCKIIGVDRFTDTPCDDWTSTQKNSHSWVAAGFGPAPTLTEAKAYIERWCNQDVELMQIADEEYLDSASDQFDMVYVDTSHDLETVRRQLRQIKRVLKHDGVAAGDDYSDQGTWGVQTAVKEGTEWHSVFANSIWLCGATALKAVGISVEVQAALP